MPVVFPFCTQLGPLEKLKPLLVYVSSDTDCKILMEYSSIKDNEDSMLLREEEGKWLFGT